MSTFAASPLAWGAVMLMSAVIGGRELFRLSRRTPDSVIIRQGLLGDFVCVGEVMLIVVGSMALLRGVLDIF